jgi:hypothetical protein
VYHFENSKRLSAVVKEIKNPDFLVLKDLSKNKAVKIIKEKFLIFRMGFLS